MNICFRKFEYAAASFSLLVIIQELLHIFTPII